MVIDENAILELAEHKNFNMELFGAYLKYQNECRQNYPGKWSVEEYAAVMMLEDPEIDFFTHERLEWFGNWQGFGGEYYIPDCLSFLRYCGRRDLYAYNEELSVQKNITRKRKKEEN